MLSKPAGALEIQACESISQSQPITGGAQRAKSGPLTQTETTWPQERRSESALPTIIGNLDGTLIGAHFRSQNSVFNRPFRRVKPHLYRYLKSDEGAAARQRGWLIELAVWKTIALGASRAGRAAAQAARSHRVTVGFGPRRLRSTAVASRPDDISTTNCCPSFCERCWQARRAPVARYFTTRNPWPSQAARWPMLGREYHARNQLGQPGGKFLGDVWGNGFLRS
jgi:hypothetical protein